MSAPTPDYLSEEKGRQVSARKPKADRTPFDIGYAGDFDRRVPAVCERVGGYFVCAQERYVSVFKPGDPAPATREAWAEWADVQIRGGVRQKRCRVCSRWRFPQETNLGRCTNRVGCSAGNPGPETKWAQIIPRSRTARGRRLR